jgi:hypothetical protein
MRRRLRDRDYLAANPSQYDASAIGSNRGRLFPKRVHAVLVFLVRISEDFFDGRVNCARELHRYRNIRQVHARLDRSDRLSRHTSAFPKLCLR